MNSDKRTEAEPLTECNPDNISLENESKGSQNFRNFDNELLPPPDLNLNGSELPENTTLSSYEHLRITDTTDIPYYEPILTINGYRISTPETITTISGASKAGKSALMSILIAGSISNDIDGLDSVVIMPNDEHKAVIHFDTEQDRWTQQYNHKTILKRARIDHCPEFMLSYNIRQLPIENYQDIVNDICRAATEQFNGIHSIWIDGGADFIHDTNNSEQSNGIVKYFEVLAQNYHTTIFIVVHTNPGSDKERGHFGSQCQRKSTAILSVKKEGNVSYIDPKLLRYAGDDIPKIQFRYDHEKGYHVQCEVDSPQDRKASEKLNKLQVYCDKIFSGQRSYTWTHAIEAIMKETALGRNTAINTFKELKAHDLITQSDDKNWRKNSEQV